MLLAASEFTFGAGPLKVNGVLVFYADAKLLGILSFFTNNYNMLQRYDSVHLGSDSVLEISLTCQIKQGI